MLFTHFTSNKIAIFAPFSGLRAGSISVSVPFFVRDIVYNIVQERGRVVPLFAQPGGEERGQAGSIPGGVLAPWHALKPHARESGGPGGSLHI